MPEHKEQAIRERAYAIWVEEGRADGKDLEHWLRAEAEINSADQESKEPNAIPAIP
ncbi:MAG: DUF2934 domain-containing protein [Stellaceae bacterium]